MEHLSREQISSIFCRHEKDSAIVAGIRINEPIVLKRLGNKSLWFIKKVEKA